MTTNTMTVSDLMALGVPLHIAQALYSWMGEMDSLHPIPFVHKEKLAVLVARGYFDQRAATV